MRLAVWNVMVFRFTHFCMFPHAIMNIPYAGQVIAQDLRDEFEFFETPEGPTSTDNSFMGYSIAVGHFNNDSLQGAFSISVHC
jgi:hypothetical protein